MIDRLEPRSAATESSAGGVALIGRAVSQGACWDPQSAYVASGECRPPTRCANSGFLSRVPSLDLSAIVYKISVANMRFAVKCYTKVPARKLSSSGWLSRARPGIRGHASGWIWRSLMSRLQAPGGVGPGTPRSVFIAPIVPTGWRKTLEYAKASTVIMMAMTPSLRASNRELFIA